MTIPTQKPDFAEGTETQVFDVDGMTCSACSARVEHILSNVRGVVTAHVSLTLERATVTVSLPLEQESLIGPVANAGFRLIPIPADRPPPEDARRSGIGDQIALIFAVLLAIPFVLQMVAGLVQDWTGIGWHMPSSLEVVLASIIQFGIGARYYRGAFRSLRGGSANMDVLVVLGTTTAYLYSWYLWADLEVGTRGHLYFEASAMIITLVLIGKNIESRARRNASSAMRELLEIRPMTAHVRLPDGGEQERPVNNLRAGDIVICRPGNRVGADGVVVRGEAEIDEALITGESVPAQKRPGDEVLAGSINLNGYLEIEARDIGTESTLGRVIRLVEDAQIGKPKIQRIVDQVSAIFVPVVVGLSAITFVAWLLVGADMGTAIINSVSVLVIACPCALGLATPTAIVTGAGAAARAGILIREIEALEHSNNLTHVVFDKTGTLTEGQPRIISTISLSEKEEDELLSVAASLQQGSEHPFATAFKQLATERKLSLTRVKKFRNLIARGVEGEIEGVCYLLGNLKLFEETSAILPPPNVSPSGETSVVWLASRGETGYKYLARFELIDTLRPDAFKLIEELRNLGVKTLLVSGDTEAVVSKVGQQAGINETYSRATPEDKDRIVQNLMDSGAKVCMVGDGINDAPALARATVGIAMGSGTDVAMETAAITLLRPDPFLVASTIELSRRTIRKIKQNLFWAFIYNVIGLPLAALGYLFPAVAAGMMACSSISVILNSLTLRLWKPRTRHH